MRAFLPIALALGFAGCLFTDIEELRDGSPIAAISPGSYPLGGFGLALAAYVGEDDDGNPISRVIATGGPGTAQLAFDIWDGATPGSRTLVFDGCEDAGDCEIGSGADVVGVPRWGGQRDCVLSSSVRVGGLPGEGVLRIQCEGGDSPFTALPPVEGIDFGRSLAPLFLDHPLGIALIGAPGDGGGAIYRLEEDRITPTAIPIPSELGLNSDARLGQQLAAFDLGTNIDELNQAVLILAAAKNQRRVVALIAGFGPEGLDTVPVGCIDGVAVRAPAEQVDQGGSIALADFDGNGFPEAIIGDPANNRVRIVPLMAFTRAMGCDGAPVPEVVIDCEDLPQGLVEGCGSFGAALTAGDFDGDGHVDLAVGAPTSGARGLVGVGAVYVIPNDGGALRPAGAQSIIVGGLDTGDGFGTSLATASTRLTGDIRVEPVASAPGRNRLYVLYCTGLPGDAYDNANRCLVE